MLAASCIRKPTAGMKVTTASERAKFSRKLVFELLVGRPAGTRGGARSEFPFLGLGRTGRRRRQPLPGAGKSGPRPQPSGDGGAARRLHPVQSLRPRLPRGAGQRRDRHGRARARREDRLRFRRSDGREHLRRLRRVRAGLPDRRADAGDGVGCQGRCTPTTPTARSTASAPIAASAASSPTRSRTTRSSRSTARTARRTTTGSASRAASASTMCTIGTG